MNSNDRYDSLFQYYATRYNLLWLYLKAQVRAESNFDPLARSGVGAFGLAQFMPATWIEIWMHLISSTVVSDELILSHGFNPELQIEFQAYYISKLVRRYNSNYYMVFAAYNWGMGHIDKLIDELGAQYDEEFVSRLPLETKNYVSRIMNDPLLKV